jgi:hypothetical protein
MEGLLMYISIQLSVITGLLVYIAYKMRGWR